MSQEGDEEHIHIYYTQDGLDNNLIRTLLNNREGNVRITTE